MFLRGGVLRRPPRFWRFVVAIGLVALAAGVSYALRDLVAQNPFILFFAAVAISAWYGGLRPGLVTTILSVLVVNYFFIPPIGEFSLAVPDLVRGVVFIVVAGLISWLSEARRQTEAQFAVTLASIGDAVIATDAEGRVTFMNGVAEHLTGWLQIEAYGRPLQEIFHIVNAHTRNLVENPVERVLREGTVVGLANHTCLIARDGTERPIDDSGAPIRDNRGRVIGVVLVFRDVTEREQAEVEQRVLLTREQAALTAATEAQAQLATVFDRITDSFAAFDREWRYTYVNTQAARLSQKPVDELIGQRLWDVFPDVVGATSYQMLQRSMEEQIPIAFEDYYAPFNVWTQTYTYPSSDGLTVYIRDITEEKQAQLAAEQSAGRVESLNAIMGSLATALTPQHVGEVIVRQGAAALGAEAGMVAQVVEDNTALEYLSVVGYPPDLVAPGMRQDINLDLPLSSAARTHQMILIESREAGAERWPGLAETHQLIDLHAWANIPLMLDDRVIGAIDLSFRQPRTFTDDDRTFLQTLAQQCAQALDRARLYAAEQEARERAEAAVRIRDQFLSIAAHELKTPLTSLLGYAQLFQRRMLREGTMLERDQRSLRVMVEQAQRLNRMVQALLDISRLELGQLTITREAVDIGVLVRRIVEENQHTLESRSLQLHAPDTPLIIQGDELRLEQVIQNLIQNALKYSAANAPITIIVEGNSPYVSIAVVDQGIGIPQNALPLLFQRFYRASNAEQRQISGIGVGLYVVREIVTMHGGEVSVESTEGQGSTFTVRLPLDPTQ